MDDMVVWHADADALRTICEQCRTYLGNVLSLELKTASLNRTCRGMDFLLTAFQSGGAGRPKMVALGC